MEQINLKINELPVPTWNKLRMNFAESTVTVPTEACEPQLELTGNVFYEKKPHDVCDFSKRNPCKSFYDIPTGLGSDMDKLGTPKPMRIVARAGKSVAKIIFNYDGAQSFYNRLEIDAQENSDVTIFMLYSSAPELAGTSAVQTKILADDNAKIKLVQIQLLGEKFIHFNDVGCELDAAACFELVQLQLGAQKIFNGARSELYGQGAFFKSSVAYYGRNAQKIDLSFIANHHGKKTESLLLGDGVLQQGAHKIYRGTIDFKNGCAGSVGDEEEKVLLLSDDVINQSIPLILCSEEDVQGNHGASIGKTDDELLFYLCSRGFTQQAAIKMLARAKIEALARQIDDENIAGLLEQYLEGIA